MEPFEREPICLFFFIYLFFILYWTISSDGKESACNAGEPGSIPGLGRSPGERNGYPLRYSCLENSMDRRVWRATVHEITKRRT